MADEKPVRHIVEHVHQLGDGHGDGHAGDVAGHAALTEILFAVHGIPPSTIAGHQYITEPVKRPEKQTPSVPVPPPSGKLTENPPDPRHAPSISQVFLLFLQRRQIRTNFLSPIVYDSFAASLRPAHSGKEVHDTMQNITQEYLLLFNAITDAEVSLDQLRSQLISVQQQAEALFISRPEYPDQDPSPTY